MRGVDSLNRRDGDSLLGSAISAGMTSAPRSTSVFDLEHGVGSGNQRFKQIGNAVGGSLPVMRRRGMLHEMNDVDDAMRAHVQTEQTKVVMEEYHKIRSR